MLLTPEQVEKIIASLRWGESSPNPGLKQNQEADVDCPELLQALSGLPVFPRYILPPRFNRYGVGDYYKPHTDAPILGKIRTDLSCTVWLNDDYDGGELVIDGVPHKGKPGEHIVYRGDTVHEVTPVTRGERICAITWIQSEFRDPEIRSIMADLCSVMNEGRNVRLENAVARLTRRYIER